MVYHNSLAEIIIDIHGYWYYFNLGECITHLHVHYLIADIGQDTN
jgi:hypothetical protein